MKNSNTACLTSALMICHYVWLKNALNPSGLGALSLFNAKIVALISWWEGRVVWTALLSYVIKFEITSSTSNYSCQPKTSLFHILSLSFKVFNLLLRINGITSYICVPTRSHYFLAIKMKCPHQLKFKLWSKNCWSNLKFQQ